MACSCIPGPSPGVLGGLDQAFDVAQPWASPAVAAIAAVIAFLSYRNARRARKAADDALDLAREQFEDEKANRERERTESLRRDLGEVVEKLAPVSTRIEQAAEQAAALEPDQIDIEGLVYAQKDFFEAFTRFRPFAQNLPFLQSLDTLERTIRGATRDFIEYYREPTAALGVSADDLAEIRERVNHEETVFANEMRPWLYGNS